MRGRWHACYGSGLSINIDEPKDMRPIKCSESDMHEIMGLVI